MHRLLTVSLNRHNQGGTAPGEKRERGERGGEGTNPQSVAQDRDGDQLVLGHLAEKLLMGGL